MVLNSSNYYTGTNNYLSHSKIKDFMKSKPYFKKKHILKDLPRGVSSPSMIIGSAVDVILTEGWDKFDEKYDCPVVINTSFNVRGEPIVCTPEDAYLCFMRTDMDYLIMNNFLLEKKEQRPLDKDIDWQKEFELD